MFSVGPLDSEDYQAIRALSRTLGRRAEPSLNGSEGFLVGAKDEGLSLLGWAKAQWWDPQDPLAPPGYYLGGVEVRTSAQGQGIATALSLTRLQWVAQRASSVWCVVNAQNTASLALQRSLGFTVRAQAARFGAVSFAGGAGYLLGRPVEEYRPLWGVQNDQ